MTTPASTTTGAPGGTAALPSRRWLALGLLSLAQLMLILDVTVVNVALPDIGAALHLHRSELPWVMTIYTLFFGGLMLLGGRVADLFGARRLTLIGLAASPRRRCCARCLRTPRCCSPAGRCRASARR